MLSPTKAFLNYRTLSQSQIDFAVIVCHAVPALQADLATAGTLPTHPPDHFKNTRNPTSWLKQRASQYQDELARNTLLSAFSYFEAYVKALLLEIVAFHGGALKLKALAHQRSAKFLANPPASLVEAKNKLQHNRKKNYEGKYYKHTQTLEKGGFRFPSDLLSNYGARALLAKLDNNAKNLRAFELPDVLKEALLYPMTSTEMALYEEVRDIRNKIGHGKGPNLLLKDALHHASKLHKLAAKIDNHVGDHFLIIQIG